MRVRFSYLLAACVALLLGPGLAFAQGPQGKGPPKPPKPPPDEIEEMVKEIKKAYTPINERLKDILDEIRKSYRTPSPAQEEKIFKEIRKLFLPTAEQEEAILREIRKAYIAPSPEQEQRIAEAIGKAEAIPLGRLLPDSVASRADGMFRKLDQDGDGLLSYDELPENLRRERAKYDANRDGFIDSTEYRAYFAARTQQVHEEWGGPEPKPSGGSKPSAPAAIPAETDEDEDRKPVVHRAGNLPKDLPAWFAQLDSNRDGQIDLAEWRMGGRPIEEFQRMDRNDDGFLTIAEVMYFVSGRNNLNGVPVLTASETKVAADIRSATPATAGRPSGGSPFGSGNGGWPFSSSGGKGFSKGNDPAGKGPAR